MSQLGRYGNKKLPKIKGYTHFHLSRLELEKWLYEWTRLEAIARAPEFTLQIGCAAQERRYKLEDEIREKVFGTSNLDEIAIMMGLKKSLPQVKEQRLLIKLLKKLKLKRLKVHY